MQLIQQNEKKHHLIKQWDKAQELELFLEQQEELCKQQLELHIKLLLEDQFHSKI